MIGDREIIAIRRKGFAPVGGVWIFDDWTLADRAKTRGLAVVKLKRAEDWGSLDFRFCHGLDVSLLHVECGTPRLAAIGRKLMEAEPRTFWCQWMNENEEGFALGSFVCNS